MLKATLGLILCLHLVQSYTIDSQQSHKTVGELLEDTTTKDIEEENSTNEVLQLEDLTAEFVEEDNTTEGTRNLPSSCELPPSCEEAFKDPNAKDGPYLLQLPNYLDPFYVYCMKDTEGGIPWTVIQRRQCGTVDFYRSWTEYVKGFGNLNDEFFLGLDKINALTSSQPHELWVQLEDFEGEKRYAKYEDFEIGDYSTNFTLTSVGGYQGNAGDGFKYQYGKQFSTRDMKNDKNARNCAESVKGGWWFGEMICVGSHLNGQYYGNGLQVPHQQGINWHEFRGDNYSLKYAHMAIRRWA